MAETAGELRAEIAQTREQMGRTIEALSQRVEHTKRQLSLSQQIRQRPLAISAGVVLSGLLLGFWRGRK